MNLIAKTASPGPGVSVPTLESWNFFEFSYVFHVFEKHICFLISFFKKTDNDCSTAIERYWIIVLFAQNSSPKALVGTRTGEN